MIATLVFVVFATLVGIYVGERKGKNSVVIPPPPPPEPKIFGLRQAISANGIAGNDEEANKLVRLVTEVLDYENTVSMEATEQIQMMTVSIQGHRTNVEINLEEIEALKKANKAHEEGADRIRKEADFTAAVGQRFGK